MFLSKKGNCTIIVFPFCTVVVPFIPGENCESPEKVNLPDPVLLTVYTLDLICSSFMLNSWLPLRFVLKYHVYSNSILSDVYALI